MSSVVKPRNFVPIKLNDFTVICKFYQYPSPRVPEVLESGDVSSESMEYTNLAIDNGGLTLQEANQEPAVAHAQANGASHQFKQVSARLG